MTAGFFVARDFVTSGIYASCSLPEPTLWKIVERVVHAQRSHVDLKCPVHWLL